MYSFSCARLDDQDFVTLGSLQGSRVSYLIAQKTYYVFSR